MTGEGLRLGHRPALDGLRGLAILLVVPYNFGWALLPGGFIGVDVFFVLSGFLITALLVEERRGAGRIDLPAFYGRRALRLLPALLVLLGLMVAYAVVVQRGDDARETVLASASALFYVANWVMALGDPGTVGEMMGGLAHTWSLSVEEQFYLVWPPVVGLILTRRGVRAAATVAGVVMAASALLRAGLWAAGSSDLRLYCGTDTRADGLLLGCLLALLASSDPWARIGRGPLPVGAGWAALAGLAAVALSAHSGDPAMYVAGYAAVGLAAGVLLLTLVQRPSSRLARAFSFPALVTLGRVSYGVYLWHLPVATFVTPERTGLGWGATQLLRVAVTAVAVTASWLLVERPFLRLKRRLRNRRRGGTGVGPGVAAASA